MNAYLGIDPGKSGGLVLLSDKGALLHAERMPEEEKSIYLLLWSWAREHTILKAYLEKVRSSPQMSKGSIFVFGWGYGGLRMALIACDIAFVDVGPQKWQKFMNVRDQTGARPLKDVDTTEKKHRHKAEAERLFPSARLTHAIADALLIAEYGRRCEEGFGAEFL